jgi:hypothetical protein
MLKALASEASANIPEMSTAVRKTAAAGPTAVQKRTGTSGPQNWEIRDVHNNRYASNSTDLNSWDPKKPTTAITSQTPEATGASQAAT